LLPFLTAFVSNVTPTVAISNEWKIGVNSMASERK
jgi:hypothetical protein